MVFGKRVVLMGVEGRPAKIAANRLQPLPDGVVQLGTQAGK